MKKILFILLVLSGFVLGQVDWNVKQSYVTVDISSDSSIVTVDLYSIFGNNLQENYKLIGLSTPAALTSTTLTFKVYDEVSATYKTLKTSAGAAYSITVAANFYIPLDPNIFMGIKKLQLVFGSKETADRIITLAGRVY